MITKDDCNDSPRRYNIITLNRVNAKFLNENSANLLMKNGSKIFHDIHSPKNAQILK